ncbi:uncharacterized protein LOC132301016 [Cornus florida]|uniref:uncharacterized protein LOC132301016 n=1 Tax=Cornus florida TaxID=4283 RepID=UPI00289D8C63|nr:uncharacterized protein LOC132301016 [Cornus florida]
MHGGREGDLRFPIISCLIFLCVLTGGGFLVVYVFVPDLSQPWHPVAALVLIGFPWVFWFLTYLYTCMKHSCCVNNGSGQDHQRRGATRSMAAATTTTTGGAATMNCTSRGGSPVNSMEPPRRVQFGPVVVMDGNGNGNGNGNGKGKGKGGEGDHSSIASTAGSERPLTSSVSSG